MANPAVQRVYEFGDFRLDAVHLMLSRRETELQLAPKAIETLLALVERRGKIVSKEELLESVWPDTAVEESNLFLYLSVIRKTLGAQPNGEPWIETLRRRGYRFNGEVQVVSTNNGAASDARGVNADDHGAQLAQYDWAAQADPTAFMAGRRSYSRSVLSVCLALVAIAGVLAFAYPYLGSKRIESIAVMPFRNESGDRQLDYLPEAMAESLVGKLSKVPELHVKSSTAVFMKYKGTTTNAKNVGSEMGVSAVLYGKLVRQGGETMLNLELVDAATQNAIWNRTYGRELANLAAVQGKVARDVVRELRIELSPEVERQLARNYTENTEAYILFQKGRVFLRRLERSQVETGIEYLKKAIEIDPTYALAYAGLAEAYRALGVGAEMDPHHAFPRAREAALRAIEIDEFLAEGHAALGSVKLWYDWDFRAAEESYLRALELDPNSSMANFGYAEVLSRLGRIAEAKPYRQRAFELEQLSPMIITFTSGLLEDADERLAQVQIALSLDPNFYFAHYIAGNAYREKKMYPEALAAYERAAAIAPDQTWTTVTGLTPLMIEMGKRDEAEKILADLIERSRTRFVSPGNIAILCRQLGKIDENFEWLEKAYLQRDPRIVNLKAGLTRKELADDPRFQELIRRLGF